MDPVTVNAIGTAYDAADEVEIFPMIRRVEVELLDSNDEPAAGKIRWTHTSDDGTTTEAEQDVPVTQPVWILQNPYGINPFNTQRALSVNGKLDTGTGSLRVTVF